MKTEETIQYLNNSKPGFRKCKLPLLILVMIYLYTFKCPLRGGGQSKFKFSI